MDRLPQAGQRPLPAIAAFSTTALGHGVDQSAARATAASRRSADAPRANCVSLVISTGRAFNMSRVGDAKPVVFGQEALVQACIGARVPDCLYKITHCRSCKEEQEHGGGAERQAGLEFLDARKFERSAKGFLDPRAGDIHAVDLVEQQMDHVAERHEAAEKPSADRTESKQVICASGTQQQEEEGGKLRMED